MEQVLGVAVRAPVASFRRPLDHNVQRTLPMPSPTALVGIAGAALGLSHRELWASDSPVASLKVAVRAEVEPGRAQDLWTLLKIQNNRMVRSPYVRELLFFARYMLVYGGDEALLERLQQAFRDPAYPLSLGREDELMAVDDVALEAADEGEPRFRGAALPGDVRQMRMRPVVEPGIRFAPPVVETLPLRFTVDGRGIRHPEAPTAVSFLPTELDVEIPELSAVRYRGRNVVWLNSSPSPTSP
ncbi:MAG: CRISPR-associated protein Cas5 [Salinibacter sp.]